MPGDQLSVEGLRLRCMLGTRQPEAPQDIVDTFSVCVDLARAARADLLADTLDLALSAKRDRLYVDSAAHELIESLATEIARVLLTEFPVASATVTVRKPDAFEDADAESVTITRERGFFPVKPKQKTQ